MVFQIDSDRHGGRRHGGNFFGLDLESLNGLINSLPVTPNYNSRNVKINVDENEIEKMVIDFVEHGEHYDDELSDKIRDLTGEQRELSWEKREYECSRRDLEFEKRNADVDRHKNIDNRLVEFNKGMAKLEVKIAGLEKFRKELGTERNQEMAKRQAAKKKLHNGSLALFEDTIGNMLYSECAGLRSLSDDENITSLLSDFVDADKDSVIGSYDKMYVFKHKYAKSCVTGKSNKTLC
ncbi:hypothetical protein [Paraglaciecola psychrophila]|uniref:Uncharacterized protein n=1 Tax=Paraglaciecola psychrophila 170 TaxID=1129794 RepID=K6Z3W3_9ALTE|nr:hypothetical protein [Paraglaciecola psychrophila]AGH43646.1 hypothetical protein C427_1537 [Paraglaciecola psychrophila 170]GAC39749.1 hypothetical protein GPSY_4138 [Paraglaciecola psychrophila 170]